MAYCEGQLKTGNPEDLKGPITFIPAIPKSLAIAGEGSSSNRHYKMLHVYLGLLTGLCVFRKGENFMKNFLNHLDTVGVKDRILNGLDDLHNQVKEQLRKRGLLEEGDLLLTEVPFVTTGIQIEKVKDLITKISKNRREKVLDRLRKLISGESRTIKLPSGREINISELFDYNPDDEKDRILLERLKEAMAYYYFDLSHNQGLRIYRAITLATARIDGLVLKKPNRNDSNKDKVNDSNSNELSKSDDNSDGYFNELRGVFNRFMLDPMNFNEEEKKVLARLVSDIISGKLGFVFIEVKSHFFKESQEENQQNQENQQNNKTNPIYLRDVSHSLLAMFEFLTMAARITGLIERPEYSFLLDLMSADYDKRLEALFASRGLLRVLANSHFLLVHINWPILEKDDKGQIIIKSSEEIESNQPQLKLEKLTRTQILRGMRDRAVSMLNE